jgi:hypothetical protein
MWERGGEPTSHRALWVPADTPGDAGGAALSRAASVDVAGADFPEPPPPPRGARVAAAVGAAAATAAAAAADEGETATERLAALDMRVAHLRSEMDRVADELERMQRDRDVLVRLHALLQNEDRSAVYRAGQPLAGRYQLLRMVGRGGFSEVFRVRGR